MIIDELWLATFTKDQDDAGTDADALNLVVNIDGTDVVDAQIPFPATDGPFSGGFGPDDENWLGQGQGAVSGSIVSGVVKGLPVPAPFDSDLLTNSSLRVGQQTDDAWGPSDILLFGLINANSVEAKQGWMALAIETEIERWLSTDPGEGKLTMPLRLVGHGTSDTMIHRVLLLTYTPGAGDESTDSKITLQISTGNGIVLNETIEDTQQDDLEPYMGNWYMGDAATAFSRNQVANGGKVVLSIGGDDAWQPQCVFVFGFDTPSGRPNNVVTLCAIPKWGLGWLSTDAGEGVDEVPLPLANVV